jgi:hypothetical protein
MPARVVAFISSLVVLAAAAWGALFVFLAADYAAKAPDPSVSDGDPCCGTPDTWGEVLEGTAGSLLFAVMDGVIVALGISLLSWGIRNRRPRWRRLALVPSACVCAVALAIAIAQLPRL